MNTTDRINRLAAALHPGNSWEIAYPVVEHETRALLERETQHTADNPQWSTTELVEALWPEETARGDMILRRQRLFKALAALAEHALSDCATKGEEQRSKFGAGRTIRPWLWHKPVNDRFSVAAKATGVPRDTVIRVANALGVVTDG